MAFYDPQEDENNQDPNAQVPGVQTQSGSSVITGQGSTSVAPGGAPQPKTNSPDRPGNFVNLQDYLNANKPQSEKLGNQASAVIQNSADTARQDVNSLNQEASQKVKGVNSLSEDVSNKIKNNAESLTPGERDSIKQTQTAAYQGPQSYNDLSSYQAASDATKKASQNIDNSGTEQGRMNLISQINSKPRTQGMNVFDNALLQAGTGREKLTQAATANQGVKGGLNEATQQIQGQIGRADDPSTPNIDESSGAIGQTNKAQADALKTVQDSLAAWRSGFEPKVTQAQQNLTDLQNRVTGDISDNPLNLTDETMNLLGLKGGQRLFNTDLSSYLTQASPTDINAANVASPEDYARYSALADLSGDQDLLLDPKNAANAGTAPTLKANSEKLQNDIQLAQANYQKAYSEQPTPNLGTYLKDPEGFGTYILGLGGLGSATPKALETYWIPMIENSGRQYERNYGPQISALKQAVNQWKANQGYNNILNPDTTAAPTFQGSGPRQKI